MKDLGQLLIIGGIAYCIYYYMFFDTSVEVPTQMLFGQQIGGGRVNNLGLMAERQNSMIMGGIATILGIALYNVKK